MTTEEINDKLAKIYALVNQGGTEGEKQAAKIALDKFLKKHNLDADVLNNIHIKEYDFKYSTELEKQLIERIMFIMVPEAIGKSGIAHYKKSIVSKLEYIDWITIECAYEYFRRHMKKEWKKVVAPELARCRKPKTRNKRRRSLNDLFFGRYVIASKLVKPEEIKKVEFKMSTREGRDRLKMSAVEGGQYNKQVVGGLLLGTGNRSDLID